MRIEDTAFLCDQVENSIRREVPAAEISSILDNIGLPYSGINLSYSNSAPVGTSDADILVTLNANHHPTAGYVNQLRLSLAKQFPGVMFAFLPSDMVTQILNFGLPAPIDIQVAGNDLEGNRVWASQLLQKVRYVPGRPTCGFSSLSMSLICTSELSAPRPRSWDSRPTTSHRICWCPSAAAFRLRPRSGSIRGPESATRSQSKLRNIARIPCRIW